jgi:hypothetical protein
MRIYSPGDKHAVAFGKLGKMREVMVDVEER